MASALIRASAYSLVGCINAHIRGKGWRGCWKDAAKLTVVSGVEHGGMRLVAEGQHWPGVLTHSLGASMLENVVDDRALFSRYRVFYLWGSFGYDFERRDFQPQLLFGRTVSSLGMLAIADFDAKESFKRGIPIFQRDYVDFGNPPAGVSLFGAVMVNKKRWNDPNPLLRAINRRLILRHEVLHTLQYRRARICNSVLDRFLYRDHNNGPVSFGQDACYLATRPLHGPEVRAFERNMLRGIVQELRGKFGKPN
ncbi:MAG: hypothetical protein ACE5MH_05265 [Terriglobia bacterium]